MNERTIEVSIDFFFECLDFTRWMERMIPKLREDGHLAKYSGLEICCGLFPCS